MPQALEDLKQLGDNTSRLWVSVFGRYTRVVIELDELIFLLKRLDLTLEKSQTRPHRKLYLDTILDSLADDLYGLQRVAEPYPKKNSGASRQRNWEKLQSRSTAQEQHFLNRLRSAVSGIDKFLIETTPLSPYALDDSWRPFKPAVNQADLRSDPWHGKLALCLDGFGIHGYAALVWLRCLVRAIARVEQKLDASTTDSFSSPLFQAMDDSPDHANDFMPVDNKHRPHWDKFRLSHYFDYICGTGTGGMIAIMLGPMRCTISEAIQYNGGIWQGIAPIFTRLSVFKSRNSSTMRESLGHALGESTIDQESIGRSSPKPLSFPSTATTMKTTIGRCQTIVFVSQNTRKGVLRPYAIRSYELSSSDRQQGDILNAGVDTTRISVVDACTATSAAPTYFKKVQMETVEGAFRDGSICKPDPAENVYKEIASRHRTTNSPITNSPLLGLLSIGAQKDRKATFSQNSQAQDDGDQFIQTRQQEEKFLYTRVPFNTTCEVSARSEDMLIKIESEAREMCRQANLQDQIERWACLLVHTRRRRCRTAHWADYAGLNVTAEANQFENTKGRRQMFEKLYEKAGCDAHVKY